MKRIALLLAILPTCVTLASPKSELTVLTKDLQQNSQNQKLCPRLLVRTTDRLVVLELDEKGTYRKINSISTTTPPAVKVSKVMQDQITVLITQLGDHSFTVREAAGKSLLEIGMPSYIALKQAVENSHDAEVQARAKMLFDKVTEAVDKSIIRINNMAVIGDNVYAQYGNTIRKLDPSLKQVATIDFQATAGVGTPDALSSQKSLKNHADYLGFSTDDRGLLYMVFEGRLVCYDLNLKEITCMVFESRFAKILELYAKHDWADGAFKFYLTVHDQVAYVHLKTMSARKDLRDFFVIDLAHPKHPELFPPVADPQWRTISLPWITTNPLRWHVGIGWARQNGQHIEYIKAPLEKLAGKNKVAPKVFWSKPGGPSAVSSMYHYITAVPKISPGWAVLTDAVFNSDDNTRKLVLAKYNHDRNIYINICQLDFPVSEVFYNGGYLYCLDKFTDTLRVIQLADKPKLVLEQGMKTLGCDGMVDLLPWPTVKK